MTGRPPEARARGGALRVLATVLTAPVVVACLGLLVEHFGVRTHLEVAVAAGVVLAVSGLDVVRIRLERLSTSTRGVGVNLVYLVVMAGTLVPLGLSILVPAASTMVAVYAVVIRPTWRRTAAMTTAVTVVSAAGLCAQPLGVSEGLLPPAVAGVVGAAFLVFSLPTIVIAAQLSRRAMSAAEALAAERRAHVAALERAALLDPLTGLLSRRGLEAPLARAAANASPVQRSAVLFLDLDGFKAVNDVHGHAAGDHLLVVVAQRLLSCVRPADAVCRTGGDEFVVVLEALAHDDEAEAVAVRVRSEVAREVRLADGSEVSVGASTGVAVVDGPVSEEALLALADAAMYEAKRATRRARDLSGRPIG